ncbi:MAG: response regulator, partial [Gammaproteobacteria bacterium]
MKILVVDDEVKTAAFLKKGLTESGFVVDVAHDGVEGLFQAQNYPYDLVILVVMMPKLNGWEVITRLRAMG